MRRGVPRGHCWTALQTSLWIPCLCGGELKELSLPAPAAGRTACSEFVCVCGCVGVFSRAGFSGIVYTFVCVYMWVLLTGVCVNKVCTHFVCTNACLCVFPRESRKCILYNNSICTVLLSTSRAQRWPCWFVSLSVCLSVRLSISLSACSTLWPRII